MNPPPKDILRRIERDFPGESGVDPLYVLVDLRRQLQSGGIVDTDRIIRCVLHLANSDADKLLHYSTRALEDWRDVIWWAEYDGRDKRLRDFSQVSAGDYQG